MLSMTQANGKRLRALITLNAYPFCFFMWYREPNAGSSPFASTSREMVQAQNAATTNAWILQTRNTQADTPDGWTSTLVETNTIGNGTDFGPEWDTDPIELDVWNQLIFDVKSSAVTDLYVGNSLQTPTKTITRNVFNDSGNVLDEIFMFSRQEVGEMPHPADFAGGGMLRRSPTVLERKRLQLYWPSSIKSLGDSGDGFTWDVNDVATGITAGHGGVDLVDLAGSSFTIDGTDNPPITFIPQTRSALEFA